MPKGGFYEENVEDEEIPSTNHAAAPNPQLDVNSDEIQAPPPPDPPKRKPNQLLMIFKGWKLYFAQSVFLGSFAYVFLYLTVLSPGSLMTGTYLLNFYTAYQSYICPLHDPRKI